jgi:thiamine biosynthesis protein ThiS
VIRIIVNGQERELPGPCTVAAYLEGLGLAGRYVAVARNGQVLERESFGAVTIEDGDRLEVVRPVGGG